VLTRPNQVETAVHGCNSWISGRTPSCCCHALNVCSNQPCFILFQTRNLLFSKVAHKASNEIKPVCSKLIINGQMQNINVIIWTRSFPDTTPSTPSTQPWTRPTNCRSWEYKCNNNFCVFQWDVCDGVDDCGDNSDEWFCSMY